MTNVVRSIDGIRFINQRELWKSIEGVSAPNRLRELLVNSGVSFFDERHDFVKSPQVGVVGVGGIPFVWDGNVSTDRVALATAPNIGLSPKSIAETMLETASYGVHNSYLNPRDKQPQLLIEQVLRRKHYSTTHMLVINLMILGASTSVENEFSCQRDIVHLARLTNARTRTQNRPPICVLLPELLPTAERVYENCKDNVQQHQRGAKSELSKLEAINVLFPAAKSTLFTITASIRNLLKLTSYLDDSGKEDEMRLILALLNGSLSSWFPNIFPPTTSYRYSLPKHLAHLGS